jgi:hypothetical protein
MLLGQGQQAGEKALKPGDRGSSGTPAAGCCEGERLREAKRKKGGQGTGAHGGQIAQAARQCPMPDRFRLVPVKPEVTAGDGQIRGHGQFLAAAGGKERAVVANSQAQAVIPAAADCAGRPSANFAEQGEFPCPASGSKMGQFYRHLTRIGQTGKILTGLTSGSGGFTVIMIEDGQCPMHQIH